MELSIVIPAYNEELTIAKLLARLARACPGAEIIVIDDHSTDKTAQIAENFARRTRVCVKVMRKVGPRGKVTALLQGFRVARKEIVAMIDADLEYPPEAIPKMYRLVKSAKADIVIGRRHFVNVSPIRVLLSKIYTILFGRCALGIPVGDVQTGEKVFRKEILEGLDIAARHWGFDIEFLFKAHRAGFRIAEIPIIYTQRAVGSKVRLIPTAIDLALTALRLVGERLRHSS